MIDEKKLIEDLIKCKELGRKSCELVGNIIRSQPKIGEWIPCSERLPEEIGNYIIHVKTGIGEDYVGMWCYQRGVHLSGNQTYIDDKQGYWCNAFNGDPINEPLSKTVIAWQPLPDLYHGP